MIDVKFMQSKDGSHFLKLSASWCLRDVKDKKSAKSLEHDDYNFINFRLFLPMFTQQLVTLWWQWARCEKNCWWSKKNMHLNVVLHFFFFGCHTQFICSTAFWCCPSCFGIGSFVWGVPAKQSFKDQWY